MHKRLKNTIMFQGVSNLNENWWVENILPQQLSNYTKVICFEYPQFNKLFKLIKSRIPLIEKKTHHLFIYHSFGLLPLGRTISPINLMNHLFNYFLLKILLHKELTNINIITFTPEISYLLPFLPKTNITYYVSDDYASLPYWSNILQRLQFRFLENILVQTVNKIFVTSDMLVQKYKNRHKQVMLFRIPSYTQIYLKYNKTRARIPPELKNIPHPIAGFIGSWYDWKVDTELIEKILKEYPNISFVFMGTINTSHTQFFSTPNFYHISSKKVAELPQYVASFDLCLIPYRTNRYGQSAYPVKIMEYLAMGKPVVTTALPSIKYLADKKLIYWAEDDQEFIEYIKISLNEKEEQELIRKRKGETKENSWERGIKNFMKIIKND